MKRIFLKIFMVFLFLFSANAKNVAILFDGHVPYWNKFIRDIKKEVSILTKDKLQVSIPSRYIADGRWSKKNIYKKFEDLMNNPNVDIIVTMGPVSSDLAIKKSFLKKPVLAPFIYNGKMQRGSKVSKKLSYIESFSDFDSNLKTFKMVTGAKQVSFFVSSYILKYLPFVKQDIISRAAKLNIDSIVTAVSEKNAVNLVSRMPKNIEGIFLTPLLNLKKKTLNKMINQINEKGIPSYSFLGKDEVERGTLCSLYAESNNNQLTRKIALHIQRIFLGDTPSRLSSRFNRVEKLVINMDTVEKIGFRPSWQILSQAILVNSKSKQLMGERLNFTQALKMALDQNYEFLGNKYILEAKKQDVSRALSNFLPHIDAFLSARTIDEDKASKSFGLNPEKAVYAKLTLSQVLYSDSAFTGYFLSKDNHEINKLDFKKIKMELMLKTAKAYLNLLRAQTIIKIYKDNLQVAKQNLRYSKMGRKIGVKKRQDIFRWEYEVSEATIKLNKAQTNEKLVTIRLNTILGNFDQEKKYRLGKVSYNDRRFFLNDHMINKYIKNPWDFKIFKLFIINEAIENSIELKSLRKALEMAKAQSSLATRAFFLPDIILKAEYNHTLDKSGLGSTTPEVITLSPNLPEIKLPQAKDSSWAVSLNLKFPLYQGGNKFSNSTRTTAKLYQVGSLLKNSEFKIKEGILSLLIKLKGRYSDILIYKNAKQIATKNLKLAKNAYKNGQVSIMKVIDGNNALLHAQQTEIDSTYQFLIEFINLERVIGYYDFLLSKREYENWFIKLNNFYNKTVPKKN